MSIYIHNEDEKILYEIPNEPFIEEKKDSKGRRVEWFVGMQINITRSDNEVIGGKWKFDVCTNPWERYDIKDSRDDVISFFLAIHKPSGDEITLADFTRIRQDYLRK